ncbi:MAG: arylsulfatase [Verrucomicrobia bacterium]|nr:arylsulfatase [Verrucomicrobiota bacterium]
MKEFATRLQGPAALLRRWVGWGGLLCLVVVTQIATAAPRPNLVIFLADDAGWGDYGVTGNPDARTPHIDSLARDGVSLNWFFVQPVCAPTRAEFLTGRYHPRSGVRGVSTGQERMDLGEKTLADAFKAAGYATGIFGKWHNGSQWPYHPNARGFDEFYGYTSGHWGEYFDPPLERNGRMERARGYIVDVCTDAALEFISRHRERPFLCYVPFPTPHSPWAVPDQYWQRYRDRTITRRATLPGQENLDHTRCALAMMENLDDNVGRVLGRLDELGLKENTIVVYFSDNGPNSWRWNGGLKGRKGGTDDGGVRSPLFIRWPKQLPAGHVVPQPAGAIDLLPTLTALAGIPRVGERPLDGRDLTPLLRRQTRDWPERTLFTHWAGRTSARTSRHRLDAAGQLFDMLTDPGQTRDIAAEQPEIARQLREAVTAWRREMFGAKEDAPPGGAVDPRPIPVGFREFPVTILPARDGEPRGGVRRSSSAPNSSYFVNWTNREGHMVWEIEVKTTGDYQVVIDYTCPEPDAGATIELAFKGERLSGKVAPGWDPPFYTNQDTLPRPPAESPMKEFRPLALGVIRLEAGRGPLVLRAVGIPGRTVMDVRRVTLTLQ